VVNSIAPSPKVPTIVGEVKHKHGLLRTMVGRRLRKLSRPGDRLRAYREYLGLSLNGIQAHFGIGGTTWSACEVRSKKVSPTILGPLSAVLPPVGKQRINLRWLASGEGDMLLPQDKVQVVTNMDALEDSVREGDQGYQAGLGPTGVFPSEVAQACQLVDTVLEAMPLEKRPTGPRKWETVATVSELLARDRLEGREGTARRFLLGLKQEWEAMQKAPAAAAADLRAPGAH
jgi:hypothetical protein